MAVTNRVPSAIRVGEANGVGVPKDLHSRASRKSEASCAGDGNIETGKVMRVTWDWDWRRAPPRKVPGAQRAEELEGVEEWGEKSG